MALRSETGTDGTDDALVQSQFTFGGPQGVRLTASGRAEYQHLLAEQRDLEARPGGVIKVFIGYAKLNDALAADIRDLLRTPPKGF